MRKMNDSGWIWRVVKGMMVSGLICVMLGSVGCGSLPWPKKKDNIYSPKPKFHQMDKKAQKSKTKPSSSLGGFLDSDRVDW